MNPTSLESGSGQPPPPSPASDVPGSPDAEQLEEGHRLIEELFNRQEPLTQSQIDRVVQFLDNSEPPSVQQSDSQERFKSKVLKLPGERYQLEPAKTNHDDASSSERPTIEHFDLEMQKDAFAFVRSDHRIEMQLEKPRPWIKIKGLKRKFYAYQLYAAFYMLVNERGARRGVIEADRMGLGKVSSCFSFCDIALSD